MTIVVGYVPRPDGRAALHAAIEQARMRGESMHVLNSTKGDAYLDSSFAAESESVEVRLLLQASGVAIVLEQKIGGREPEDVVDAAESVKATLVVIGLRRRTATGKFTFGSGAQRINESLLAETVHTLEEVHHHPPGPDQTPPLRHDPPVPR